MSGFVKSLPAQVAILAVVAATVTALIVVFAAALSLFGDPGEEATFEAAGKVAITLFVLLNVVMALGTSLVWLERKQLGRMQGRVGPTRVGPFGVLQVVADALKLVTKEDVAPANASRLLFYAAPALVFVPSFVVWLTIPLTEDLVARSLDMGLFFFIAVSVLSIVGLVLAGWSSNSKYAIIGGFRSAAQLVSYEIPIIMAVVGVAMLADSMSFIDVVDAQRTVPYIAAQPLAFLVFFVAGLAEVGRTPFDIYFAESEVVGGPFVEYSGAHWAIFFLAEYVNTFVIAALATLLFLGGWVWPFGDLPQPAAVALFLGKTYAVAGVIFWVRATLPRLRIDQLMEFGWKLLIPLAFGSIAATAVQLFYGWPLWTLTLMSLGLLAIPAAARLRTKREDARATAERYAQRAVASQRQPRPKKAQT